jgi:HK97 family phage major capsid protein
MKYDMNYSPTVLGQDANGYLKRGVSPANFQAKPLVDMNASQRKQYSIAKALQMLATDDPDAKSFEREVSDEIRRVTNRIPSAMAGSSIFIPTALETRAGLVQNTNSAGGFLVQGDVSPDLIELLRPQSRVLELGAQLLSGLKGTLSFVVETIATAATWQAENGGSDNADADQVFASKTMSPKLVVGNTSFTRRLLQQSSIDIELMVRRDLTKSLALALDAAAVAGSGASNQPTGLLSTSPAIGSVAIGANGGPATYQTICALEDAVGNANADSRQMAFLTTPDQRSKLRQVFINGTGSDAVWDDEGLLGYTSAVSRNVPGNLTKGSGTNLSAIIVGNFNELLIGEWGAVELTVDPYRLKRQAVVEVTIYGQFDILIRQPAAFAAVVDAA